MVEFNRQTAERILRATLLVEKMHRNANPQPKKSGSFPTLLFRGKLDADLADDGEAEVTLQKWNDTSEEWDDTDEKRTVRTGLYITSDLEEGTEVWITYLFNVWWVIAASCSVRE